MKFGAKHRLLSILASFSLLVNSFAAPISVLAQEATSEPTSLVEETQTPTVEATPTPSEEPTPTIEVTPIPEITTENALVEALTVETTQETTDTQTTTSLPEPDLTSPQESTSAQLNPVLSTDKGDYSPTDTVLITGTDFTPNTTYTIEITSDTGNYKFSDRVTSDESGNIFYSFQLDGTYRPNYKVEIKNGETVVATTTFTDTGGPPPKADLDQYGNDVPVGWQNGNLNANQATYYEGDSVPYRLRFDNLGTSVSHTVIIEWDTTKSSKHALDYLTTYNRTQSADPCDGVGGCGSPTTFAIPTDTQVTGAGVTQIAGNFTLYNGTITSVSAYSYLDGTGFSGDKTARISITFSTTVANPVLAWGGHIAHRSDWGQDNSAIAISGSPYHMRLIDLDGSGGNQDRSLSADAVIFPASITIIKQATPEGSTPFPFTAIPSPLTDFSLVDDGTSSNTHIFSGITTFTNQQNTPLYTVTENVPAGWSLLDIVCNVASPNGGSQNISNPTVAINLQEGENVTCTFTNQQQEAHLIVIKHVVTDNGGTAVASDFTMTINGVTATGGNSFAGAESPGIDKIVTPGSYNVTESGPAGYSASYSADCTGTIVAGQTKTCTVTNDDNAAHLIVIKHVINDNGGTATASNFTMTINSVTASGGNSFPGAESPGTDKTLTTVGSYSVTESGPAGYSDSYSANCSGTITLGQTKTCTITNDDNEPSLTLVKVVTNNNGGTATESAWTLTAVGSTGFSGAGPSVSNGASFDAGTYDLSESGPSGYTPGDWVCVGGNQTDGNTVEVGLGEDVTCTITNDDNAPSLTLVKVVTNNSGGGAYGALWTLSAAGPTGFSGLGPTVSNGLSFDAGTYTLSETGGPSGYDPSDWVCVGGGTQEGDQITLGLGESATCTITNDDIPPTLKLLKSVTNDNGGTATPGAWLLTATGENGFTDTGDSTTFHTVKAGLDGYVLSESAIAGYADGTWSCTGGDLNGETLTLGLADQITCTITNDDVAPTLTLNKIVVNDNGGIELESAWTLTATGPTPLSGLGAAGSVDVVSGTDFSAGTYTLSEAGPGGYSASSWSCTGNGTQDSNHITLALGQSATCTITNDDIGPLLTVIKEVVGGTADVEDFNLYVDSTPVTSGDQNGFDVGSYVVSEDNLEGYISEVSGDCDSEGNVTLELGDEKICTITNSLVSLSSVKSNIGPSEVLVGEIATFQAVIENTGEVTLYNPIVFDIFDTDYVDFDSSSPIDATLILDDIGPDDGSNLLGLIDYDEDGDTSEHIGLLGWEVPVDLAPGETYTITLYFIATAVTPDSEEVVSTNGIVTLVCLEDTEECSVGDTLETEISYASVDIDDIGISIEKSNDKPSALAGDTVTYTLVVTNNGESLVFDVEVTDSLPGGFTYVSGSTIINGSSEADPSISGNNLTWNVGTVIPGEPVTIVYQATIASDITSGTYTNLATCQGNPEGGFDGEFQGETIECNVADSSVGIGRGTDFSGNIPPQVLGAATELPAAGSDTALLALAIMALIAGVSLKGTAFVLTHAKPKRRKYAKN